MKADTTELNLQTISRILNGPINEIAQALELRIDNDSPFWAELEKDLLREMRRQNKLMTVQSYIQRDWEDRHWEDRHWENMAAHLERFSG